MLTGDNKENEMKSYQYIDLAMKKLNMNSLNLGLYIGISRGALSAYKSGKRQMDDYACYKIAEILDIDPKEIITRSNAEREKDQEKKEFWIERSKEYGAVKKEVLGVLVFIMFVIYFLHDLPGKAIDKLFSGFIENPDKYKASYYIDKKSSIISDYFDSVIFTVQNFEFTVMSRVYEVISSQQCILC